MSDSICKISGTRFTIDEGERALRNLCAPLIGEERIALPDPQFCPEERSRRRYTFRNEAYLYTGTDPITGQPMISLYPADTAFIVLKDKDWWADGWDARTYGFEPSDASFFEQYARLMKLVPRRALRQDGNNINCPYITYGTGCHDCHMIYGSLMCDRAFHCTWCFNCRDILDCMLTYDSERAYFCVDVKRGYNVSFLYRCSDCRDSMFLEDCMDCRNCLFSKNLRNKEYYIYNQPVSKEVFERHRDQLLQGSLMEEMLHFDRWRMQEPTRASYQLGCEGSTGDMIEGAKNCQDCFDTIAGSENCRYLHMAAREIKDCLDCTSIGLGCELCYECTACIGSYACAFSLSLRQCRNVYYSESLQQCFNCFGCNGLRNKEYCIFNKQYTAETYGPTVKKIIEGMQQRGEWGEFFPSSLSPYAYNETRANDLFPLTREEAALRGMRWRELPPVHLPMHPYAGPLTMDKTADNVINETFICPVLGRPFKVIPQEYALHKNMGIPLNPFHPRHRQELRMRMRPPRKIVQRTCARCTAEVSSVYTKDAMPSVYCDACYATCTI